MSDLAAFLLARIDDDQQQSSMDPDCGCDAPGFPLEHGIRCGVRLLADCASRRAIVELHARKEGEYPPQCRECGESCDGGDDGYVTGQNYPCRTLRLLAAPFMSHPDFDPSWQMETT